MPSSFIIIGAGLSGPTAALRLAQDGHICTVYERAAAPHTIGGAINVAPNGMRLLSRLGLRDAIASRGCTVPQMEVLDEHGARLGAFPARSRDGFCAVRIMRSALQAVLLEECEKRGVAVRFRKRLVSITEEENGEEAGKVVATFADGSTANAGFLIGADGIHSAVRQIYVAPGITEEYTKQALTYGILPTARLPDVDFSTFPLTGGIFSRRGFFAVAFTDDSRSTLYWIAAKTADKLAEKALDASEIRAEELGRFGALYDPLPRVIAATDDFFSWPVYELPPLDAWHRGRVVLVGDAAHALPPNQGQGVSQAFEDVFALARVVAAGKGLARYEELRKPRVEKLRATIRKQTREHERGPWAQWMVTWTFWAFLKVLVVLNWFWEWDQFAYDVDKEII